MLLHEESLPASDDAIACYGATVARISAAERGVLTREATSVWLLAASSARWPGSPRDTRAGRWCNGEPRTYGS